jgi:hypothetical protein
MGSRPRPAWHLAKAPARTRTSPPSSSASRAQAGAAAANFAARRRADPELALRAARAKARRPVRSGRLEERSLCWQPPRRAQPRTPTGAGPAAPRADRVRLRGSDVPTCSRAFEVWVSGLARATCLEARGLVRGQGSPRPRGRRGGRGGTRRSLPPQVPRPPDLLDGLAVRSPTATRLEPQSEGG